MEEHKRCSCTPLGLHLSPFELIYSLPVSSKLLQELQRAQVKLQSMVTLVGSEPGLRDALEERIGEIKNEISTLKSERDELTEEGEATNDK